MRVILYKIKGMKQGNFHKNIIYDKMFTISKGKSLDN